MFSKGLSDQLGQTKRFFPSVIGVLALLAIALVAVFNLFDHNDVGYATVVQFPNGSVRVITEPGIFFQGFGKLTIYKTANDTLAFSKDPKEGGEGSLGDTSIPVRFRDGGQGKVTIDVTFKLPEDKESLSRIHTDWHSYEQLERGLVRPQVNNVIQLTATKLSSEESYTQKDLFINQIFDQLTSGIYEYAMIVDQDGKINFKLKAGEKDGKVMVERQPNPFHSYKIGITKVTVRDIDYADEINLTLKAKQAAIQAQVTSKANADKAQQEALEAKARGEKMIAETIAEENAKTAAAEQELKRARLEAESIRVRADADAYAKRANATANNSLDAKLNAWVEANKAWAGSSAAPPVVFNGATSAGKGGADNLYPLLMMKMLSEQVGVNPKPER
jgi:regulator of protease activity HflC (stomatin/prohibitin superfamily)